MKSIRVHITEKTKGPKGLTLLNLRDEVVNFLYKDTLASSTKADMQFFVLLYFASIQIGDKSFLEIILDEAIPKFNRLNQAFQRKQGYLRANEYRQMVNEYGLTDIFKNDIFFVLASAILNIDAIEARFADFYSGNEQLARVVNMLNEQYRQQLESNLELFQASKIEDDRYDEDGNYHDLSKSVYRTVMMRSSRNLELNLQKYTAIRQITSNSPIDLIFIQHIHPQIIFDLWDKYHVAQYMTKAYHESAKAANSPLGSGVIGGLIVKYANFKRINGAKERKRKKAAKEAFEMARNEHGRELEQLNLRLVDSVLKANTRLEKEVDALKKEKAVQINKEPALQDKEVIKKLEARIARLENLVVATEVIDESDALVPEIKQTQ